MGNSAGCFISKKNNKIEIDTNINNFDIKNTNFNDPCIVIYKKINEKDPYLRWYNYLYKNINNNNSIK